jgi:TolB-like protein/tetratricopeptide (TPR) repeat protein
MADADDNHQATDGALEATQGLPVTPSPGTSPSPTPGRRFARGELIAERYKVVRQIGEGGMGEVYEAQDLLLRDDVALKIIRHDVAGDEKVVERFKREIQLARKVTHPNVCRIFDVGLHRVAGTRTDIAFLTMELLVGETLAARLTRAGRFTPAEAAPLVAQMAAALDAAHHAGIVHRDLKSANVMLVDAPDGVRAVVTDFGLARGQHGAADPSITGDGGVVGSPSYMAPEQVEGKDITAAADLYAFGVVLYEMVTGRLPFVGDTPLSTAVKRLREDPVPPCAHVAGLDPRWEAAILHCLRRDPAQRPRSARAVAAALAAPAPWFSGWRRRATIGAAAAALLTAGLVGAVAPWRAAPAVTASAAGLATAAREDTSRRAVAVMGFKNLTNRPEASWISGALTEMVATELSAGDDVRVIPGEAVARAKRELALGDEIGFADDTLGKVRHLLGADYVLSGSYYMTGSVLRLDLKLVDTRTGEPAAVVSQTGVEGDLVALVERTGQTMRARLSLNELSPTEREAARASQPRPDVARLYAEGLAHLRVAACSAARGPLEQAVATDPNFPLARSALAEALHCLGHESRALAEAKKAAELAADLPEQIRLVTEAKLFKLGGQPDKALEAYARLFERFPDNFDYGFALAHLQLGLMREDELPRTLAALRALPPPAGNNPRIDLLETYVEQMAGRTVSALERVQRARARADEQGLRLVAADAQLVEAKLLVQLKREEEALATTERARAIYEAANDLDGIAKTLAIEAAVREGRGDREGALRAERQVQSIARDLENPRQMLHFKYILGLRMASLGRVETALQAFDDAGEIARGVGDDDSRVMAASLGAAMLLLSGDLVAAEERLLAAPADGASKDRRAGAKARQAVLRAMRDDEKASRARLEEAEALAGPKGRAQVAIVRAQLALNDGRPEEAERLARGIMTASPAWAPEARFVLAGALLERGKHDEAGPVLREIEAEQYKGEFAGELWVAILRARLRAASDVNDARRLLTTAEATARGLGVRLVVLEARRALAELELEHGDARQGKVLYAQLARDAAATGLERMARKARERIQ